MLCLRAPLLDARQKKSRLRTTGKGKKGTLTCTPRKGKRKKLKIS